MSFYASYPITGGGGGGGTVTSVGLADASTNPIFTVSGSPVTTTGTLTLTLETQSANTVFAGPSSGSAAQPSFRSLVLADLPSVNSDTGSFGSSTSIPSFTVNAEGLITAASGNAVVAPAGTLSGITLNSTVTGSSLTSLGVQAQALNMGTFAINDLANPTNAQDAATKYYVDNAISGLEWKAPVQAYSTSNVALTGSTPLVIDGYTVLNGNSVILANQTTTSQNGVYTCTIVISTYTLTLRETAEVGFAYLVLDGTVYAYDSFVVSSISPTVYTQFAGPTEYSFTSPLSLTGTTVSLGIVPYNKGGTGQSSTFTQYGVTYASSTTALATTAAGTANYPLVANSSAAPTFQQLSLTAGVTGTLPIGNGGTGTASAPTQYGVVYAASTTAYASTGAGSAGQVLTSNASSAPTYQSIPGNTALLTIPTVQNFLQAFYYTFTISAHTYAVGQVYSNNSSHFTTVYASTQPGQPTTTLVAYLSSGTNAPSSSGTLTYVSGTDTGNISYSAVSDNGTYYPTATNVLYIKITATGGGGGGASSGESGTAFNGFAGTATTFGNSTFITASGGGGGINAPAGVGGSGGSATISTSSTVFSLKTITGGSGAGSLQSNADASHTYAGQNGGNNPLGGGGGGGAANSSGGNGVVNTGGGGQSGGVTGTSETGFSTGGGGGAGGYAEALVTSLSSAAFIIGPGGDGAAAGTGGYQGGSGAQGGIWIEEYYQ